jgi:hypothetical protein
MAGRTISRQEREGVPSTDTSARTPLGVGISYTAKGNEKALGRSQKRRRKDRDMAGISPPEPIHPDSPALIPGDQGG